MFDRPVIKPELKSSDHIVEGTQLAQDLIENKIELNNIIIDCRKIPSDYLISPYINSFLAELIRIKPGAIDEVKNIEWLCMYDFQEKNINAWVKGYVDGLQI